MREPWEMYTVSRTQNMVQIRKKHAYFVTICFRYFSFLLLGLSASRAPAEGPFTDGRNLSDGILEETFQYRVRCEIAYEFRCSRC